MADIKLSWTAPSNTVNVDSLAVYRASGTVSLSASCSEIQQVSIGSSLSEDVEISDTTYVDAGVSIGSYTYAVFSKNVSGYSPCASTTITIS